MSINMKARQTKLTVGPSAGEYRFIMSAQIYSSLNQAKVISEAALRSTMSEGVLNAAWGAIGDVIRAWCTEGHSVAVPGLGTMRFGVQAKAVAKVEDVSSSLITSRRVIFTPSTKIKEELKKTSIDITCYDKDGKVIKRVTSEDDAAIDDSSNTQTPPTGGGSTNTGGGDNVEEL